MVLYCCINGDTFGSFSLISDADFLATIENFSDGEVKRFNINFKIQFQITTIKIGTSSH